MTPSRKRLLSVIEALSLIEVELDALIGAQERRSGIDTLADLKYSRSQVHSEIVRLSPLIAHM